MMTNTAVYHYFRVVIQANTPHGIHQDHGDVTHDVLLLRDVNNLPAIPATSLAGVLRHLYMDTYGLTETEHLFGYADGEDGAISALSISWALVNDSDNNAIEGIRPDVTSDALLHFLARDKPIVRQRVRLNSQGCTDDNGKFDITLIPAGTRYTFFVGYWSDGSNEQEARIHQALSLLQSPAFRLGHGTRSGYGSFGLCSIEGAHWDLRTREGQKGYSERPRKRAEVGNLKPISIEALQDTVLSVDINIKAESGWRIGGGEQSLGASSEQEKAPDLLPQSEILICWSGQQKATLSHRQAVIPASAVKGALSHRVAFHYRRLSGEFAEQGVSSGHTECDAVSTLFGSANSDIEVQGAAGLVIIDDVYIEAPKVTSQMHNRIDMFTGGVINGALFEEELLWQTPLSLKLTILNQDKVSTLARKALLLSLDDLTQGWLPLGAGGSRGHGCFLGATQWSNNAWSDEQVESL
jgi:CRISPR/Cas system CSM-associated protein Csm3 (group 7 of RAMP superfamily)